MWQLSSFVLLLLLEWFTNNVRMGFASKGCLIWRTMSLAISQAVQTDNLKLESPPRNKLTTPTPSMSRRIWAWQLATVQSGRKAQKQRLVASSIPSAAFGQRTSNNLRRIQKHRARILAIRLQCYSVRLRHFYNQRFKFFSMLLRESHLLDPSDHKHEFSHKLLKIDMQLTFMWFTS